MKYFLINILCLFSFCLPLCPTASAKTQKIAYLTFDDGPSEKVTTIILDVLKKRNIKATFFVVGKNCLRAPETLKRIFNEGHSVGVHSFSHDYKEIYKDTKSLYGDIKKCEDAIKKVEPNFTRKLYRFPGGSFTVKKELIDFVIKKGYVYYDWNASNLDCEIKDATALKLLDGVKFTTHNKNTVIILMHDASSKLQTAISLEMVIDYLISENFTFKCL